MSLRFRATKRDGVMPIPAGVMIETRSERYGSLFLRAVGTDGTTYTITRGVKGAAFFSHHVPLAPYRRKYVSGRGWTLC
jgi:hypothetical protein